MELNVRNGMKIYNYENCNHKYEYIATERTPTDQWEYGYRIYKEEVIVYCPLCHTHKRMSKDEWKTYHGFAATINRKYSDTPICSFSKNKLATFIAEESYVDPYLIDKLNKLDAVTQAKRGI